MSVFCTSQKILKKLLRTDFILINPPHLKINILITQVRFSELPFLSFLPSFLHLALYRSEATRHSGQSPSDRRAVRSSLRLAVTSDCWLEIQHITKNYYVTWSHDHEYVRKKPSDVMWWDVMCCDWVIKDLTEDREQRMWADSAQQ